MALGREAVATAGQVEAQIAAEDSAHQREIALQDKAGWRSLIRDIAILVALVALIVVLHESKADLTAMLAIFGAFVGYAMKDRLPELPRKGRKPHGQPTPRHAVVDELIGADG